MTWTVHQSFAGRAGVKFARITFRAAAPARSLVTKESDMDKWRLPNWETIRYSKSFVIEGPLDLEIDYDDVNHIGVRALAEEVVDTLNKNFITPTIVACEEGETEDCYTWSSRTLYPRCPWCGGPTRENDAST